MKKKLMLGIIWMLLLTGMLALAFDIHPVKAGTVVVPDDYPTIQAAINAANAGDTIYVRPSMYYENVVINKTVSLVGEDKYSTIIDANGTGTVFTIQADNSSVEGFTIQNGGFGVAIFGNSTRRNVGNVISGNIFQKNADAIGLSTCDRNIIANNTFESNGINIIVGWINPYATWDVTSNNNTITGNNLTQGLVGILTLYSMHNVISENNVSNMTDEGITFLSETGYPIVTNNSICNNVIVNCTSGLSLSGLNAYGEEWWGLGSFNNVSGNVIQHNELGLYVYGGGNHTIMDNVLENNVFGMYLDSRNNLLRSNRMFKNIYNFVSMEVAMRTQSNDVDSSNTVNGKPMYYLVNETNLNINPLTYPDLGFLALKNCLNVTIQNLTFSNNGFGIVLEECTNVTISNTTIEHNIIAISTYDSTDVKIRNSTIKNNLHGVSLLSGKRIDVKSNSIMNNSVRRLLQVVTPYFLQTMPRSIQDLIWLDSGIIYAPLMRFSGGICLWGTSNSTIVDNNVTNNEHGILLLGSSFNVFKNNTMTSNVYNFGIDPYYLVPREWGRNPPDSPQISPYLMNDVDTSNTVDGKPIYWWINRHDEQVPNDAGYILLVNSTSMMIKDLTLQNNVQSAFLIGVSNSSISDNAITNSQYGIDIRSLMLLPASTNNTVTQNNITKNGIGIWASSPNTLISQNLLMNNIFGMYIFDNITAADNTIANSTNPPSNEWIFGYPVHLYIEERFEWFFFNKEGVGVILEGSNTTLHSNKIENNHYGISVNYFNYRQEGNNEIYHNNFVNNTQDVWRGLPGHPMTNNTWDNGYPSSGNYWSNHTGVDEFSGLDQDELGSDGIGDTPCVIDENNRDNYPLMGPFNTFDAGVWNEVAYNVDIVSNSTVSDFYFSPDEGAFLMFNVTGTDGTAGFCRVTISEGLLWTDNGWTINVNNETITNYEEFSDSNNTYLYFTYNHSTNMVLIQGTHVIPEFPSIMILPLLMTIAMVTAVFTKKKIRWKKLEP